MKKLISTLIFLPHITLAQSAQEEEIIKQLFANLNPQSIEENVEFCGYIGQNTDGELAVTPPTKGEPGSCYADDPVSLELIFASYHTHGAYSYDYSSELPSGNDMEADEQEGIDGWVATPGGRLWYIDTTDMITRQICGLGCLPADPNFVAGDDGRILESYTYDELVTKLDG